MILLALYLTLIDNKKLFTFTVSLVCSLYFAFEFNLLFNWEKCPDCYGNELCRFFQNRQIQLTYFSYFLSLFNSKWTKSVFHGFFNETRVVVKRKGGNLEGKNVFDVDLNGDEPRKVVLCSSVTNRFFLFEAIKDEIRGKKLWFQLKNSIEPLLLKYFGSAGNWPFPKYLGACGDYIIVEHKGEPLHNFLLLDFKMRAQLAIQLLKIADALTLDHPDLAFYFIDYSLDNLVVDSSGNVFLIDLDSVIISNKSAEKYGHSEKKIHNSEILHESEYAFSPSDICNHYLSDHNYFSVCKYLLTHPADGLLKDVPADLKGRNKLLHLLNECVLPSELTDRFSAGRKLRHFLFEIINNKVL